MEWITSNHWVIDLAILLLIVGYMVFKVIAKRTKTTVDDEIVAQIDKLLPTDLFEEVRERLGRLQAAEDEAQLRPVIKPPAEEPPELEPPADDLDD